MLNILPNGVELQLYAKKIAIWEVSLITKFSPDGVVFEVSSENLVDVSLNRGDIVSFSYERYSRRAAPVDPIVYRVRADLIWENVVQDHIRYASQPLMLNGACRFPLVLYC